MTLFPFIKNRTEKSLKAQVLYVTSISTLANSYTFLGSKPDSSSPSYTGEHACMHVCVCAYTHTRGGREREHSKEQRRRVGLLFCNLLIGIGLENKHLSHSGQLLYVCIILHVFSGGL